MDRTHIDRYSVDPGLSRAQRLVETAVVAERSALLDDQLEPDGALVRILFAMERNVRAVSTCPSGVGLLGRRALSGWINNLGG